MTTETYANFWSPKPDSAFWYVQRPDGTITRYSAPWWTILADLRAKMDRPMPWGWDSAANYAWTIDHTRNLYRILHSNSDRPGALERRGTTELPAFTPYQQNWTKPMLRQALWYTYHEDDVRPDAVHLPLDVVLPEYNQIAPGVTGATPQDLSRRPPAAQQLALGTQPPWQEPATAFVPTPPPAHTPNTTVLPDSHRTPGRAGAIVAGVVVGAALAWLVLD